MATKTIAAILFAGLFACLHAETSTGRMPAAASIAVFYSFEKAPSPDLVSNMQDELSRILAPSGVQLTWRPIGQNHGYEDYPEIVVLRFRGTCEIASPPVSFAPVFNELGLETAVHELAETHRSDGKVLPFGDVECDHLSRYLAPVALSEPSRVRNGVLGRAMARVTAHEIYHMLTGSTAHGKQGIARASHSRGELTAKKFDFAKPEREWLREWCNRSILAGEALSPADVARTR